MSSKIGKKKVKLSEEEKEYIRRIANTTGIDELIVKKVFLSLITCITLDLYSGKKDFKIPYFIKGNIRIKKQINDKGYFEYKEDYQIESLEAFHNIASKLESKQSTWIEEFIRNEISKQLTLKTQ